ncbi:Signal transduction histidine kinase [Salinibacillus kushneri]|uniref:histidine kinase n=1 Tax=Salinibacillus kushneri TaxID=237682 RepID=A0A1I0GM33_9BACI|nr:sensor histidine kinase [Salinibacillus kushneri]SET72040.1 Signal transduction histidine kinase [Salinibacillus kushneri]
MRPFWYSFLPLLLLTALALFNEYQEEHVLPFMLVFYSLFFIVYFVIPLVGWPLIIYVIMTLIISGLEWLNGSYLNLYVLLTGFYLIINSLSDLPVKAFRIYFFYQMFSICVLLYLHEQLHLASVLLAILVGYPLIKWNKIQVEQSEKQEMYEKLVSEYRKLKRQTHESERAARLEERTKMARDIHDSVGHNLTALLMKLQILTMQEKKEEYEDLKQLASDSLEETRHAVKTLQAEESEGISSVLQLIRKLEAESHIHLDFTLKQGVLSAHLTNEQNIVLYRVLQESLTNAMRHAFSREVKVVLALNAAEDLAFTIKNRVHNDVGWQWGFGLTNMKKRVEELDGKLKVYQHEQEFVVDGILPLREEKVDAL